MGRTNAGRAPVAPRTRPTRDRDRAHRCGRGGEGVSGQGRTLPQLGPVLVLYLAIELFSSAGRLDAAALVVAALGLLAALVPLVLGRIEEQDGTRRLTAV